MSSYLSNLLGRATAPARGLRPLAASQPVFPVAPTTTVREDTIFGGFSSEEPAFASASSESPRSPKPASRYVDVGRAEDAPGSLAHDVKIEDFDSHSSAPLLKTAPERGQPTPHENLHGPAHSETPVVSRAVEMTPAPLLNRPQLTLGPQQTRSNRADPLSKPAAKQVAEGGTTPTAFDDPQMPWSVNTQVIHREAREKIAPFSVPSARSTDDANVVPPAGDRNSRLPSAPPVSEISLPLALDARRTEPRRESPVGPVENSFDQTPTPVHSEQPLAPYPTSRVQRRAVSAASNRALEQAEPVVHITIGRLEVRGSTSAVPPRAEKPASTAPSLEEYLRRRSRGSHE